jgi:hypothetical protein
MVGLYFKRDSQLFMHLIKDPYPLSGPGSTPKDMGLIATDRSLDILARRNEESSRYDPGRDGELVMAAPARTKRSIVVLRFSSAVIEFKSSNLWLHSWLRSQISSAGHS